MTIPRRPSTQPSVTGQARRRPGRPALEASGAPSVNVHVRLSSAQYDATLAQATAARVPLATWVRRVLRAAGDPKP